MSRSVATLSLVLWAACAPLGPPPTPEDRVPEVTLSATALRAAYAREGGFLVSPLLDTPEHATVAGLLVETRAEDGPIAFEARGLDERGRHGPWVAAEETWREGTLSVARAELGVVAIGVELRLLETDAQRLRILTWSAVVPEPLEPLSVSAIDTSRAALSATLQAAGVHSRAEWGARATQCSTLDSAKYRMAVHHTVSPTMSGGAFEPRLRAIQAFHMDSRGWCDVGYHFFVTVDGDKWEAREDRFLGAHVGSNNDGNAGVVFVGCFQPGDPTCDDPEFAPTTPPEVMIQGGGQLLGLLSREYGITVSATSVLGHRQHAGANTGCPGDTLFARMADLRSIAGGGMTGPTPGSAKGVVFDLSITTGPADPGNLRVISARVTASTGASTTVRTDDAFWSFDLPAGHYSFTAEAPGYETAMRELDVTAGGETWGSIGLVPSQMMSHPIPVSVLVFDGGQGREHALAGAQVTLGAYAPALTSSAGVANFAVVAAGDLLLAVSKDGYLASSRNVTIGGAGPIALEVGLSPVPSMMMMMNEPPVMEEPSPDDSAPPPVTEAESGCGCTTRTRSSPAPLCLWLAALLLARRRAH